MGAATSPQFYQGVATGNSAVSFSLKFLIISVHVSLLHVSVCHWEDLNLLQYRRYQLWSKVITAEVKQRPTLVTARAGPGVSVTPPPPPPFSKLFLSNQPTTGGKSDMTIW